MNPAMMKKLQKMQKDMMKAQKELEESIFTGTAGGGIVTIEAKGTKEIVSIKISPDAVDPEDVELLEDTVLAAVNETMRQIDEATQDTMGQFTKGSGIPGLF